MNEPAKMNLVSVFRGSTRRATCVFTDEGTLRRAQVIFPIDWAREPLMASGVLDPLGNKKDDVDFQTENKGSLSLYFSFLGYSTSIGTVYMARPFVSDKKDRRERKSLEKEFQDAAISLLEPGKTIIVEKTAEPKSIELKPIMTLMEESFQMMKTLAKHYDDEFLIAEMMVKHTQLVGEFEKLKQSLDNP